MWYSATIKTAASDEPVTAAEAMAQCRALEWDKDGNPLPSDDDDLIARLISAARDHVEHYCGVRFASQTVEMKCDSFADFVRLPEGPVTEISAITYIDTTGETQTLSTDVYELLIYDGLEGAIILKGGQRWPAIRPGSRITVEAEVGYDTAPAAVKHAMLMLIATWYAQRESVLIGATVDNLPMPAGVDALLCNFRRGV